MGVVWCVCVCGCSLVFKFTQSLRPGLFKKGQLPENSLPGLPRRRAWRTQLQRLSVTLPGREVNSRKAAVGWK